MGIFDRIRKIFSRSDSSSTSRNRSPHEHGARLHGHNNEVATEINHVVQRSYQVEHNRHFTISASSQRSSNVTDRPSATALHRSNTTSVAARASNTSHTQPDIDLKRANSCKGFALPLSGNAIHSAEYVKLTNTAKNVSQQPRSTGSHEVHVKDDSKISIENDYGQKYQRPSDSKAISATYGTTSVSKSKAPDLNILQRTTKPEYRKQTANQNTLSNMGNVDNVNPSEFGRTTKLKMPLTSISTTRSGNREYRSTVEVDRSCSTSKYLMPTTSAAQTASIKSYNTPAISQQGATFNKNNTTQTSSNTKTSVFVCRLPDHNRGIGGFGNTQQSTSLSKTGTSNITKTSALVPSLTLHKVESPKLSDHSRGFREVFGNSQQGVKLNKTNTAQTSSHSKASVHVPLVTSYKCGSTTIPDQMSAPMNYRPSIPQYTRTYIVEDKFVEKPGASLPDPPGVLISRFPRFGFYPVKGTCIPQSAVCIFANVICISTNVSPPYSSVSSHGELLFLRDFNDDSSTESNLQRLNPSSKISTPLKARVTPIPAKESESKYFKDMKPQYSLRNFTYKLQTPPKDKNFKLENDSVYHNQWTECSAQIFNNPVHSQVTVDVSSNSWHVDFRDIKIKKGRLHFRMKCCQTGNISILIKIDDFTLTKDLYVTFNPCSSSLSNMAIEKINLVEDEFVFRVFIFDVFGEPVPSNSIANYEVDASFRSTENKVVRKVKHIEQEQICYDITVRGERPWSRDLVVLLNGEQVSHVREFEFTDEECDAINYLEYEDYEWIQQFFDEGDCGIFIPLTTGEDDGKFVTYDENDCELQSQNKNHKLICKNVRKYDILGADFAHVDNMKRVLELKNRIEVQETDGRAIIDLRNIKSHLYPICKEVVKHLLGGLYYRKKASEAARVRMEWKNRLISIDEVFWLDKKTPSFVFCKYFKDFFDDLLNKYNREACDELFKFFNFLRDESEVDLHGLLVADEKKLESLRLNLLAGFLSQEQIKEILQTHKIKSKQGRERQAFRRKFRSGEVPENVVKRFIRGDRKGFMDELQHECSDEDCNLCFQNDSDNYGSEYGDDYDDGGDDYDDGSEHYDDDGNEYYDDDDYDDGSEYYDDDNEYYDDNDGSEYYDDDNEYYDDNDGSEYYDDDDGSGYHDLESLRSSGRSECFQNESESSGRNDRVNDVDAIIRRCRSESDEAIRKLKEKLDKFNLQDAIKNNTPWLEIIVGAGRHSRKNEQNIRPKVEKLLKGRNLKFAAVNKGSLVVTFQTYSGPEPCFGEYYCKKCDRCWKSSKSYVRKYQKCARCKVNCWPVKQREKEKVVNYHRDSAGPVKRQSKPHQSSLCQKCQELGRHCNEDDYYDSNY